MYFLKGAHMTKNELLHKSLYELRIIGRKLGVKSVTTLKKYDLVKYIMDISTGDKKPVFTNQGRKPYSYTNSNLEFSKEKIKIIDEILDRAKKRNFRFIKQLKRITKARYPFIFIV